MMLEIINLSCLNFLILSAFFLTDFKVHIVNTIFRKDFESVSQAENYIFLHKDIRILWSDFTLSGLIRCPICFNIWVSFFVSLIGLNIIYFPIIFFISIMSFKIFNKK
jgi:hypothetical protein